MMMNALAVSRDGVPFGLVDRIYWARAPREKRTEAAKRNAQRPFEEKETANFVRAADNAMKRLAPAGVTGWVVIDREADNRDILLGLADANASLRSGHTGTGPRSVKTV